MSSDTPTVPDGRDNGGEQPLVPAISRATAALSVLLDMPDGATLSDIAKRAGLSKSTASNLLRTMVAEELLVQDPETRRVQLGPLLVELGAVAIGRTVPVAEARRFMTRLAESTGLACLAIQRMTDGHFLAVEKIESRQNIKVTIELGERFPSDAPLLSRLWNAWSPDRQDGGERHAYTETTITEDAQLRAVEAEVRERGYASVLGEYIPGLNVVGFPVFGPGAAPRLLVTLLGMGDALDADTIEKLGPELRAAARQITISSGGRLPAQYPA